MWQVLLQAEGCQTTKLGQLAVPSSKSLEPALGYSKKMAADFSGVMGRNERGRRREWSNLLRIGYGSRPASSALRRGYKRVDDDRNVGGAIPSSPLSWFIMLWASKRRKSKRRHLRRKNSRRLVSRRANSMLTSDEIVRLRGVRSTDKRDEGCRISSGVCEERSRACAVCNN